VQKNDVRPTVSTMLNGSCAEATLQAVSAPANPSSTPAQTLRNAPRYPGSDGLAQGMSQTTMKATTFSANSLFDPTRAEFWQQSWPGMLPSRTLAETVRDFERAVELTKNEKNENGTQIRSQLRESRQELQQAMQSQGASTTVEQFTEREERFAQAVCLMNRQWPQADRCCDS